MRKNSEEIVRACHNACVIVVDGLRKESYDRR